jgi:hypothetical protein
MRQSIRNVFAAPAAQDAMELYELGLHEVDEVFGSHIPNQELRRLYRAEVERCLQELWDVDAAREQALWSEIEKDFEVCECCLEAHP